MPSRKSKLKGGAFGQMYMDNEKRFYKINRMDTDVGLIYDKNDTTIKTNDIEDIEDIEGIKGIKDIVDILELVNNKLVFVDTDKIKESITGIARASGTSAILIQFDYPDKTVIKTAYNIDDDFQIEDIPKDMVIRKNLDPTRRFQHCVHKVVQLQKVAKAFGAAHALKQKCMEAVQNGPTYHPDPLVAFSCTLSETYGAADYFLRNEKIAGILTKFDQIQDDVPLKIQDGVPIHIHEDFYIKKQGDTILLSFDGNAEDKYKLFADHLKSLQRLQQAGGGSDDAGQTIRDEDEGLAPVFCGLVGGAFAGACVGAAGAAVYGISTGVIMGGVLTAKTLSYVIAGLMVSILQPEVLAAIGIAAAVGGLIWAGYELYKYIKRRLGATGQESLEPESERKALKFDVCDPEKAQTLFTIFGEIDVTSWKTDKLKQERREILEKLQTKETHEGDKGLLKLQLLVVNSLYMHERKKQYFLDVLKHETPEWLSSFVEKNINCQENPEKYYMQILAGKMMEESPYEEDYSGLYFDPMLRSAKGEPRNILEL